MDKSILKNPGNVKFSDLLNICIRYFGKPRIKGHTVEIALKEIVCVVKETIKWMKEENEPIPEPFGKKKYKGNLTLRVPSEAHRSLAIKSAEQGVSTEVIANSHVPLNFLKIYFHFPHLTPSIALHSALENEIYLM